MKIRNKYIEKILEFYAVTFLLFTIVLFAQPLVSQASLLSRPYGGRVTGFVPAVIAPPYVCPKYAIIKNSSLVSLDPPIFGVYVTPFTEPLLYDHRNLYFPGTPVLGAHDLIPFPTCFAFYPVYKISYSILLLHNLTGTGLGF